MFPFDIAILKSFLDNYARIPFFSKTYQKLFRKSF